jgi:hypothetical protein
MTSHPSLPRRSHRCGDRSARPGRSPGAAEATQRTALLAHQPIETDSYRRSAPRCWPGWGAIPLPPSPARHRGGRAPAAGGAQAPASRADRDGTGPPRRAGSCAPPRHPPPQPPRDGTSWAAFSCPLGRGAEAIAQLEHLILTYRAAPQVPKPPCPRQGATASKAMRRRDFLRAAGVLAGAPLLALPGCGWCGRRSCWSRWTTQADHLRAGVVFRLLEQAAGPGGSQLSERAFLIPKTTR